MACASSKGDLTAVCGAGCEVNALPLFRRHLAWCAAVNTVCPPSDRSDAVVSPRIVQSKSEVHNLHVWDKTTASSRVGRTRRISDSEIPETELPPKLLAKLRKGVVPAATVMLSKEHWRREDEPMADFLAKKREMFLVQMALDTKRDEIQKLEQKAQMKEAAIKKSELLLEEVCVCVLLRASRCPVASCECVVLCGCVVVGCTSVAIR